MESDETPEKAAKHSHSKAELLALAKRLRDRAERQPDLSEACRDDARRTARNLEALAKRREC